MAFGIFKILTGEYQFAEALIADFRAKHDAGGTRWTASFPCSDNGIRDLVDLAFYASLLQEEARTLRFRVVFGSDNADLLPHAVMQRMLRRFSRPFAR